MSVVIKAPNEFIHASSPTVFLAGSIEMGTAVDWQKNVAEQLRDVEPLTILSPRRDGWDSSWAQSIGCPPFREQVEWELDALDACDFILMYFAPGTKSPISLLELGLYAGSGKLIVCCPPSFWRRGNVEIVCYRYGITCVESLEEAVAEVLEQL